MYKNIMADLMKELSGLSLRKQELILESLSKEKLVPLQIDDKIFMVTEEVNDLIDNLAAQVEELKMEKIIVGQKKN